MRRGLFASALLTFVLAVGALSVWLFPTREPSSAGLWSPASGMITGREEHTATLLKNGAVLVTGGTDGRGKPLASAEIYDPMTNRWTRAAAMSTTRLDHTATLLPSGKVLVAGGLDATFPANSLASAELYVPATNAWSAAAPMIGSRARHTATLLPDGRVLVVGGLSVALEQSGFFPGQPTSAEIYDPKTDRWSATAPMALYRLDQTATLLRDGRVLVAGGQDALASAEIYDPGQDRWVAAAPMITAGYGQTATLLPGGDVLVTGGSGRGPGPPDAPLISLSSAEFYDPNLNRWSAVATTAETHAKHTATLLRGGKILVLGAFDRLRAELYDPARKTWSMTGAPMVRYQHTATRLPDDRVLIAGGYSIDSLDSVLLYDPTGVPPRQPIDPRAITALLVAAVLVAASFAFSIPAIRQRLKTLRPQGESEDWIT